MEQVEATKVIKPLIRKLKRCRDPDRADLVALQKARRELASQKETRIPKAEGDGSVFGGNGGGLGGNEARDAKRRKVTEGDDVFVRVLSIAKYTQASRSVRVFGKTLHRVFSRFSTFLPTVYAFALFFPLVLPGVVFRPSDYQSSAQQASL